MAKYVDMTATLKLDALGRLGEDISKDTSIVMPEDAPDEFEKVMKDILEEKS